MDASRRRAALRAAAAGDLRLLRGAVEAFQEAKKNDGASEEIKKALREAMEAMRRSEEQGPN
ncbi:hypothetical protein ACP4OV_022921 [Aristida adscensionis]